MKPKGEIDQKYVARVSHSRHEVDEVLGSPVVVLEVLYNQHPLAVHRVHLVSPCCVPERHSSCLSTSQGTINHLPTEDSFISQPGILDHTKAPWQQLQALQVESTKSNNVFFHKRCYKNSLHPSCVCIKCFTDHCLCTRNMLVTVQINRHNALSNLCIPSASLIFSFSVNVATKWASSQNTVRKKKITAHLA